MEKHATGLKGGRSQHCQFVYSKRQFSHLPTPPTRFIRSTSHRTTKLTEAPTICVKSARTKFDKLKNRLPPGRRIAATARALVPQRQIDMAPLISSLLPISQLTPKSTFGCPHHRTSRGWPRIISQLQVLLREALWFNPGGVNLCIANDTFLIFAEANGILMVRQH